MGQAEYEDFKAKLREWMEAHPEAYAAFEESMNTRDMAGCQAVLLQAIALIPQYRKLAAAKANEGLFDHVDAIERSGTAATVSGTRTPADAGRPHLPINTVCGCNRRRSRRYRRDCRRRNRPTNAPSSDGPRSP